MLAELGICIGLVVLLWAYLYVYNRIMTGYRAPLVTQNKSYLVRCYPVKMKRYEHRDVPIPANLPEEPGQDKRTPIHFNVTITNYGLCITAQSERYTGVKTATGNDSPLNLFTRDWSNPIIIPLRDINLYYISYNRKGSMEFELTPANVAGYMDEIPKIPKGEQLKIVVVFMNVIDFNDRNNKREVTFLSLEQPLKLKLIALDKNGDDDVAATNELYRTIYEGIKSLIPDEDDDESWMYRSRPIVW